MAYTKNTLLKSETALIQSYFSFNRAFCAKMLQHFFFICKNNSQRLCIDSADKQLRVGNHVSTLMMFPRHMMFRLSRLMALL